MTQIYLEPNPEVHELICCLCTRKVPATTRKAQHIVGTWRKHLAYQSTMCGNRCNYRHRASPWTHGRALTGVSTPGSTPCW